MTEPQFHHHLGVYAFIPNDHRTHVLLIKKSLGCYTGLYDLPGGSMDPHETPEETLIRETLEETHCTITSFQQLGALTVLYPFEKDGQNHILRHIGIIYAADITGTPASGPAGGDSDGCVWVPMTDLSPTTCAPLILQALAAWQNQPK